MKYLAFDIEAANGYKPYSICSIGVVIADENLNILSQRNLWINPKTKYDLDGTRKNVGINLHLDVELLERSPDFSEAYEEIKGFLTDPEYTIVGHAVESDVHMLNAACKKYGLPCINFRFICSQLLYKLYTGATEVRALNKIADDIGVTFNFHSSDEDARVSMMTLKYLTEKTGLTVNGLLEKFSVRIGENNDFTLTRTVSLAENLPKKKKQYHYSKSVREKVLAENADKTIGLAEGKTSSQELPADETDGKAVNANAMNNSVDGNDDTDNNGNENHNENFVSDAPTRGNSAKSAEILRKRSRNYTKKAARPDASVNKDEKTVKHIGKAYSKPFENKNGIANSKNKSDTEGRKTGYHGRKRTLSEVLKENQSKQDARGEVVSEVKTEVNAVSAPENTVSTVENTISTAENTINESFVNANTISTDGVAMPEKHN